MGFNPSNFPPIADAERLRTQADKFKTGAGNVEDLATDSYTSWSRMPSVYEAPEASIVYGAFGPVKTSGQDLADDAATVKSAIDTYAGEAESIKSRYESLMVRWRSVEAQKTGDDEWQEDEELVKEDNDILSDANALVAEYMAAQRACANKITAIYGGPTYVPTTQEGAGPGEKQFGFTGEQLDAAAAEGKLPWGEPSEYDAPWWEDGWDIVASFGKGVWSGVTGTATGLWNMVNFGDWDTFTTTWKGIGTLAVDTAIMTTPALAGAVGPKRRQEAGQRLLAVGKSAIHWDEWQEDPAYAAGASTFDLATILLTAGAGAVTKTGSVASKISTVAGAGSKAGTAVRVTGLGAAARATVKVSDLATDLKIKSLDLGTSVTQKLGNVAPGPSRVDAVPERAPAHAGVDSPDSGPSASAVEHGNTRMDTQADGGGSRAPAGGATEPASGSNAPATTGPQNGSPDGGSPDSEGSDAPGDGDPDGTDPPKATVTASNPDGTPQAVIMPDGDTHTVSMASDQLADSTAARQEPVLASARDHGLDQQKFEELIHKRGDELTAEQAEKLVDIRHDIEYSNGPDTIFQKVLNPGFVEGTLDNSSPDRFTQRMHGFISDGADTGHLRTSEEIIDGLRLDYASSPFNPDTAVHAVRFQTPQVENIGIPDELLRQQLPDGHPAADLPDVMGSVPDAPHTSTGWTGSTVDGERIIPEYSTQDGGVRMRQGAEMWRLDRAGEEVLVGIFDGDEWVRVG